MNKNSKVSVLKKRSKFRDSSFMLLLLFIAICSVSLANPALAQKSAYESQEYRSGANIHTPIVHQEYYKGERELLGYNPRFTPNVITFDSSSVPYIRTEDGFIQILDQSGEWRKFDFKPFLKKAFPNWDGKMKKGPFADERIVFDADGDAYMVVKTQQWSALMHSKDNCRSWGIYPLPLSCDSALETEIPSLARREPPCVSLFHGNEFSILLPKKQSDGTLMLPPPVKISDTTLMVIQHSGGGNVTRTIAGSTYVVFSSSIPQEGMEGTPQFIVRYDHASGTVTPPVYLGNNGYGVPDNHNLPCIEVDSKGYLHVLLGSHHDPFKYFRSLKPFDISAWSMPVSVGDEKTKMGEGSFTYTGLIIDKSDTLHVVARWGGEGYKDRLVYFGKKQDQSWGPMTVLIEPFKTHYSVWYHKISLDPHGRIFVSYKYYGNELTADQRAAYLEKWPEEKGAFPPEDLKYYPNGQWLDAIRYHAPCLLISNDSGTSWRLALTEDMQWGITPGKAQPVEKFANSIGMPFVKIPSGHFIMGSLDGARDEKPLHAVTLSKSFNMGQFSVRVKDFEAFVKATGYKTEFETLPTKATCAWLKGEYKRPDPEAFGQLSWRSPGIPQTGDHPVVLVTIKDARAFCDWLSKKERRTYRLPTEAEREYACRAGTITCYSFGDSPEMLPNYGWFKSNAKGTQPVGKLLPNSFGLYDMHGNVWEYCEDDYAPYSDMPSVDRVAKGDPQFGPIIRGGSWIDDRYGEHKGFNLRSASRYHVYYPLVMLDWVGFRVVMEAPVQSGN